MREREALLVTLTQERNRQHALNHREHSLETLRTLVEQRIALLQEQITHLEAAMQHLVEQQAEAAFRHLPAGLRLGSSASVEVQVADHTGVLILPRAAFLSTGGEALAYVLSGDRAERREVSFGAQNDTQVEVVSGLQAGERVITSSYEAFKDQPSIQAPPGGEIGPNGPDSSSSGESP